MALERGGRVASGDRLDVLLREMDAALTGEVGALEDMGLEAAGLARAVGNPRAECLAERAIAVSELRRGFPERAVPRVERALAIARGLGEAGLVMTLLGTLGTSAEMMGDTRRSDDARLEVESLARAAGDRARLGGSMADRGSFLGLRGDAVAGADLLRAGIEILRPLGVTQGLRWSLLQLSMLESRTGRQAEARAHLEEALPAELDGEDPLMLTNIVGACFGLALADGRLSIAEGLWPTLLGALRTHGIYWRRPGFLEDLARPLVVALGRGSVEEWLDVPRAAAAREDLVAAIRAAS